MTRFHDQSWKASTIRFALLVGAICGFGIGVVIGAWLW